VSAVSGLLERLPHRKLAGQVNDGISDGITALGKSEGELLNGERIRFRFAQSTCWGLAVGLLAAAMVAGWYDGLWEVKWYVHVGPVYFHLFYLKDWWDNLIRYPWWTLYRHGAFRDLLEPAIASLAVKTLMAKRKWWGSRVKTWRLVVTPFLVILLAIALGVVGIWLIDFSLPWAWEHVTSALGHPGFKISAHFLGKLSVPQLALGLLVIGPIIHRVWAPVGATIQGILLDRSVDKKQAIIRRAGLTLDRAVEIDQAGWHIIPAWVRHAFSPPVIREHWTELWRGNVAVREVVLKHWARILRTMVLAIAVIFVILSTALGLIGHYWAGTGHTFPYLFP